MSSKAQLLLENAIAMGYADPQAGLELARKALRSADLRCLRVRCAAQIANVLSVLGKLAQSDRIFRAAYSVADGCPCCAPILDRNRAKLLSARGQHSDAEALATRAVDASMRRQRPLSLVYRAYVRQIDCRPGAAADLCTALPLLTPGSDHHRAAQFNMLDSLVQSKTEEDLERAYGLLPELEQSFRGLRDVSRQRAHFAWLSGQVKASLTEYRPADSWVLINESSDALAAGCRKFRILKLPDCHAACWADWAVVQYMKARHFDKARGSFSDRLSWEPARRDRRIPKPFGPFAVPARPILAGDPLPLLTFRTATKQGDPLLPYP